MSVWFFFFRERTSSTYGPSRKVRLGTSDAPSSSSVRDPSLPRSSSMPPCPVSLSARRLKSSSRSSRKKWSWLSPRESFSSLAPSRAISPIVTARWPSRWTSPWSRQFCSKPFTYKQNCQMFGCVSSEGCEALFVFINLPNHR